jgi:outer membrane protein TolC
MRNELALTLLLLAAGAHAEERIGFGDAVRQALQRNPNVTVALEEINRARGLAEEVRAQWLPTLSLNGTFTQLDTDRTLNGNIVTPASQVNGNLYLTVPLVQARGWTQSSHARDNIKVAQLSAAEVRRQLAVAVARTYLSIIAERRVVEVTERALAAAGAHYDFAHQRFTSGYGSRLDQTRAAQEVATDRAQVERARSALFRLEESLGVLLGVDHAVTTADDAPALGEAPPDESTAESEVDRLRSDVKLGQLRVSAAHHLVRDNWADYLPTLYGTFAPFLQDPATLTLPRAGWQAQLLLSWSIYDGGLRYGLSKERKAIEKEAAAQLEGTLRQARSDVRSAIEEVRRSVAALAAARDAAREAADAQVLTAAGYRAGASTNIEVIDAERAARDAATVVAQAEDSERQALLDLLIATGRFPANN